jgi:hypothetical protein
MQQVSHASYKRKNYNDEFTSPGCGLYKVPLIDTLLTCISKDILYRQLRCWCHVRRPFLLLTLCKPVNWRVSISILLRIRKYIEEICIAEPWSDISVVTSRQLAWTCRLCRNLLYFFNTVIYSFIFQTYICWYSWSFIVDCSTLVDSVMEYHTHRCQCSVWLQTDRPGFGPQQRQTVFPLASVSRPAVRPTQPPVQSVLGSLSRGF